MSQEPSSVITQVPLGVSAGSAHHNEGGPPPATATTPLFNAPTSTSAAPRSNNAESNHPPITSKGESKKSKRSNFLCSLICCLGRRQAEFKENESHLTGGVSPLTGDLVDGQHPKASSGSTKGVKPLLGELRPDHLNRKCIVIDLDETLVHSSFKPINNADFIVPVEIDGTIHQVYVLKRPHVDEFLCRMGELYECVLFTASLAKYADPVADLLDKWDVFHSRLFRESCVFHRGNYVKDLSRLGREIQKIIIVDNSPASYIFHPDNAVPVASWFDDMNDRELLDLIPFLTNLSKVDSVYGLLRSKFRSPPPSAPLPGTGSTASSGGVIAQVASPSNSVITSVEPKS